MVPWLCANMPFRSSMLCNIQCTPCKVRITICGNVLCASVKLTEPPDAEPHVRWCERSAAIAASYSILGAKLEGIYRKDIYELPPDSIRELIINAVMNCSFLQNSHIQVAIYDDRLEITSPGGFMPGVTLDKMKEGYSKIRNRALAHAFSYMNLIEAWGSGIPKLMEAMQEYGLREPEFRDMEIGFRINPYRNMEETRIGTDQDVQKVDQDIQKLTDDAVKISVYTEYNLTDKSKAVLALIKEQPDITERDCSSIGVEN